MSETSRSEVLAERRAMDALARLQSRADPKAWTWDDINQAYTDIAPVGGFGALLRAGDTIPVPTSNLQANLLPSFMTAPDYKTPVFDWASRQGMDLPTYQSRYQSLPFKFNPDGTMTYDPSQAVNPIIYNDDGSGFIKAMNVLGPLAMGAGLGGFLPGTESIFGGLGGAGTAAGGGAAELASMADLGSSMLGGEIAGATGAGAAGAASGLESILGPLNGGIDEGALGQILGTNQIGDPFMQAYTPIGTGGGSTGLPLPGAAGVTGNAATSASTLSNVLKKLGIDVDPSTLGLVGTGLSTLLGAYGSKQQTDALKDIANRSDAQRGPALAAFNNAVANPNSWYQSAPATGALDAVLRKLSANVGNVAFDPGAVAQAAAYNLGGYNDYLKTMGNLGLSGQDTSARLQTNAVMSNNNLYNALGSGISSLTSNQPNYQITLQQMLDKYFKSGTGLS